jgi:hypothetical protein
MNLRHVSINKNFEKLDKKKNTFFYLPSINSLNFVNGFEKKIDREIIYITFDMATHDTLSELDRKSILCNPNPKENINTKSYYKRLKNRWNYNNAILRVIGNEFRGGDEYFFYLKIIDYWGSLIARYLSQNSEDIELKFIVQDKENIDYKVVYSLNPKKLFDQIIDSVTYKLPLHWHKTSKGIGSYLGVRNNFLDKYSVTKLFGFDDIFHYPETIYNSKNKDKSIDRLILGGYSINDNSFYNSDDVKGVYLQTLKSFPNTFHKYHPGASIPDDLSDKFFQINPDIPVEYSKYNIRVAIGGFSNALITLSNSGTKCVSYLNLVQTFDSFDKEKIIKNCLDRSNNKIHFPKTIDEFLDLIK